MDVYNNVALGAIAISCFAEKIDMTVARATLLMPFVMHDETVTYVSKRNIKVGSLEELLISKPSLAAAYGKRFYEYLPLTINSICLAKDLSWIGVEGDVIISENPPNNMSEEGRRAEKIKKSINNIAHIFTRDTSELVYLLGVEL